MPEEESKPNVDWKDWKDKIVGFWNNSVGLNKIPNFLELLEKGLEKELPMEPGSEDKEPIPLGEIPVDAKLRDSGWIRKFYERIFPTSHIFRITQRYGREFLDNFMPISPGDYIGRGSYKFVYKLPWNQVVKVGKSKFPSDPLFGSLYKEVARNLEKYLKPEELSLKDFLQSKVRSRSAKDDIEFKFRRLGLERLQYWKLKTLIPDLVLPTRFYMGWRVRKTPWGVPLVSLTPCDNQKILPGKHMKEFVRLREKIPQNPIADALFPKWKLNFDTAQFGVISRPHLKRIAFDFHRIIEVTKYLAEEEKLIFDVHSENVIITFPDYTLKLFDFHLFDEHLYEPSQENPSPELDHIRMIEEFIRSFEL
ncbi:hypothetical protein [Leptospira sp. GIMC2001]|uniref:hypothetical protein n=1 Tax=Leptospira sp. GIMC2001 TaxID=1513297 RepID=UPI00300E1874